MPKSVICGTYALKIIHSYSVNIATDNFIEALTLPLLKNKTQSSKHMCCSMCVGVWLRFCVRRRRGQQVASLLFEVGLCCSHGAK